MILGHGELTCVIFDISNIFTVINHDFKFLRNYLRVEGPVNQLSVVLKSRAEV